MNENNDSIMMTSLEDQIQLMSSPNNDVDVSISNNTTIEQNITVTSDAVDKFGRLQVGHMCTPTKDESKLYVTVTIPNSLKNSLISKVVLRLYQNYSTYAESGLPIDLYHVNSFKTEDLVFEEKNRVATILTNSDTGCYRNLDITGIAKQTLGNSVYFVLAMRNYGECCCNCDVQNAAFFSNGKVQITCAGYPPTPGVYKIENNNSHKHIYAGDGMVAEGDIVTQCHGDKITSPYMMYADMWQIRNHSYDFYTIHSMMNPGIALAVQMVNGVNRVVTKDIGSCTAEVPEDARWLIIPCGDNWIFYNCLTKLVISTGDDVNSMSALRVESYVNECCVGQHWKLSEVTSAPTSDIFLYSSLLGWIEVNSDKIALPIGKSTKLIAVYYSPDCSDSRRWSSSNSSVAEVSSSGVVTAKSAGTVTITAAVGCNTAKFTLNVIDGDIAIIKSTDHSFVNEKIHLSSITVDLDKTVTWESSNTNMATVDANGVVTVKNIGAFDITAHADGLADQTVTLYGVLRDDVYTLKDVQSGQYFAVASPNVKKDGEDLRRADVTSASSDNTVESMWHIRYQSNGEYVIRSYARPRLILMLEDNNPDDVYVDTVGENTTTYASDGKWTITANSAGLVLRNVSTKKALAFTSGSSNLTAKTVTYVENSSKQQWVVNSVSNPPEELVVLDLETGKYIANGETLNIIMGHNYKTRAIYRSPDNLEQLFTWTENNTDVAIVNAKGYVTTQGVGEATINVETRNANLSLSFNIVIRVPVSRVSVPSCLKVTKGKTIRVYANIYPSDATNQKVTWKSAKPGIIDVAYSIFSNSFREESYCDFVAKNAGTTTITVTTEDGSYHDTCTVEVKEKEDVKITKDGKFFKVVFEDHTTWESIEHDLNNPANRSNSPLFGEYVEEDENYCNIYDYEKRLL